MEAYSSRISNRIENSGRGAVMRQLANPLGAISAMLKWNRLEIDVNRRHVFGGWHDVVGHLVVCHAAVLPDHSFVESIADTLRNAAFNLPTREHRVQHAAHFLH